jgi:O-antigen/teichoic acid export membrane protein
MKIVKASIQSLFNSSLAKYAGIYTVSNILEKGIPFAILPILSRVLTKDDVGYYTLYQALLTLLIPLYTLSVDSSVILNYFKIDFEKFKVYFSNGIFLFLVVFALVTGISFLFYDSIVDLVTFPFLWFIFIIIIVALQFFTALRKSLWQIKNEPKKYAIFSIALAIFKNGIGLLLILNTELGWRGIIIGHLIGQVIFCIYSLVTFNKQGLIVFIVNWSDILDLLKIGIPLSFHRFGAWLSDSLNRFVISAIIGVAATGSYGIGATFGIIVTIVQDAFNRAYVPYLFKNLKIYSEAIREQLFKTTLYFYLGLILFSCFVSLFGYYGVGIIFGDNYEDTRSFIVPLVFAAAFNGLYKIHSNYIFFTKKTYKIMLITCSMGIFNIGIVYFLVKYYGIIGAAYSTLFIQIFSYLITFYVSNKIYPVFVSNEIKV